MHFAATIKTVAINRKTKMCAKYKIPATKTEYAPNIKHALINKMRLLSGVYGIMQTLTGMDTSTMHSFTHHATSLASYTVE